MPKADKRNSMQVDHYSLSEDQGLNKPGRIGETQQTIAQIVKSLPRGTHLTAPEVFEKAKALGLDISLSTVYRTLHRLKSVGNVMTVAGERGLRYETKEEGPEHDHLICLGCGLTVEFVDESIHSFGKTVAQRKGFEHKASRFDILGYCRACAIKDEPHRNEQSQQLLTNLLSTLETASTLVIQALEQSKFNKSHKDFQPIHVSIQKIQDAMEECTSTLAVLTNVPNNSTHGD